MEIQPSSPDVAAARDGEEPLKASTRLLIKPREPIAPASLAFFNLPYLRKQSEFLDKLSDLEVVEFILESDPETIVDRCGSTPKPNEFFDPDLYGVLNKDTRATNPIAHFIRYGFAEGRSFNPLVDLDYVSSVVSLQRDSLHCFQQLRLLMDEQILSAHPLIDPEFVSREAPGLTPYRAYRAVVSGQAKPPLSPHPLFNVEYYQQLRQVTFSSTAEALLDFLMEPNQPPPIYLFNRRFYASQVNFTEGTDPYLHFVSRAAEEKVPTHPAMDIEYYEIQAKERRLSIDTHPLVHFVKVGRHIGCNLVRAFDPEYYCWQTGEQERPLEHYLVQGYRSHSPSPAIDLEFVAGSNRDFRTGETEVLGWLYGKQPGTRPSPHSRFDPAAYLEFYNDVRNAGLCPVQHFIEWGMAEDRKPNRFFTHDYVRHALSNVLITRSAAYAYFWHELWKRPRILFVSHDATLTGAPAIILRLLEDFSATQMFECFSLFDDDGARMPHFREVSHTYVLTHAGRKYGAEAKEPAEEVRSVIEPLLRNKPIVAFVNSAESRHIGRAIARLGIPVITLLHEVASFYPAETFGDIYAWSQRVVFPSQYVRSEADRLSADTSGKVVIRGQGLLKDSFGQLDRKLVRPAVFQSLGIPANAHLVLSCGTMDLRKGFDYFVAAAREYLTKGAGAKPTYFVWIGDGDRWSNSPYFFAREEARIYGIEKFVKFIGPRTNVEPYFVAADVFLMTARADPFPCVIHEAMACGLPIVGFENAGGAPELYGKNGRTVRFGDPSAMAEALREILTTDERRGELARLSRDRILSDWRSQDYFEFFVRDLDRMFGAEYSARLQAKPFRQPVVSVLRQGVLDGRGEYLAHIYQVIATAGIECRLLRSSFASNQDGRFSQVAPDLEDERFANLIAVPGRSVADLVRQMDAAGGGVLLLDVSMLSKLSDAVLTPRLALGVLVTSPTELNEVATYAAALQLVLVPDATVADSMESAMPMLADKCQVVEIASPKTVSSPPFSGRILISALDPLVSPLDAIRRAIPLVSVARHCRPDLSVSILCPDREARKLVSFAAENYALRDFDVMPISGGRDLASAATAGDVFLSLAELDTLPVGLIAAIEGGAIPMVMGQLHWLRNALNPSGVGFAFEASEIDEARSFMKARASGVSVDPVPSTAQSNNLIRSIETLLSACREGSVGRALGTQYLS